MLILRFAFWIFLSIRKWNMEYKCEIVKTAPIGWSELRGHIRRPPLNTRPYEKIFVLRHIRRPGVFYFRGGGGVIHVDPYFSEKEKKEEKEVEWDAR